MTTPTPTPTPERREYSYLDLLDWRRRVAEMYAAVRRAGACAAGSAWQTFRAQRDELFRHHPATPLAPDQIRHFAGLPYFAYQPAWRVLGEVDWQVEPQQQEVALPEGLLRYARVGRVHFALAGEDAALSLFWLGGYGGGLFLPFRDATGGQSTYGGGRYLYDTIKGADLGTESGRLVLDFNYAYNPSCAYHPRWICPLAPAENTLPIPVEAGEQSA